MHAGKPREVAKAEGQRNLERQAAVARIAMRLGIEADMGTIEEETLAELRRTKNDLLVYQQLVDDLVADGGVAALMISTGNPKKPNEVEKHFWLARRDEERDRFAAQRSDARKLGIEEARLEQQERIAERDAERVIAVIRLSIDGLKQMLLAAGFDKGEVERLYREQMPQIVARAIDATSREVTR